MDDEVPPNEFNSNNKDLVTLRRSVTPPLPTRIPSPNATVNGLRGALEGKLERREAPEALIARNILRASPTTAGRVTAGVQELKWKQTADALGAHIKEKLTNPKDISPGEGTPQNPTPFSDRQEAIKQSLNERAPRTDLVKRGVIVDDQPDNDLQPSTPVLPRVRKNAVATPPSVSISTPALLSPHQSPTPPRSPVSPFSARRKRASSLIVPGSSRSSTPIQHDVSDGESSSGGSGSSHLRINTRNSYAYLLNTDIRNMAYSIVSPQISQNGMMIQRLEGEAGIPYICCTGGYVWVGYKSGTALAFQSLCLEPNDELRQDPGSSHSFIRALVAVGTHVWCGQTSGEIHIWDGTDGEHLHTINAHPGVGVSALYYSERSGQVWSGGGDGKILVWSAATRQCVRRTSQSHAGAVHIITQVGNQIWTIADSVSGAFLYEADPYTGNGTPTQPNGHPPSAFANGKPSSRAAALSPVPYARTPTPPPRKVKETCGEEMPTVVHLGAGVLCLLGVPIHETSSVLMWVGTSEGAIRVVDPDSKEVVRVLSGHSSKVNTMILVGAHVWSASNDKSIRIWSARSMDLLRTIPDAHSGNIYSLCLSGNHVWSGSTDRSVRVWDAAGALELLGSLLDNALLGIADLEVRQRRNEEKLAQSEAHAKQSAEEVTSLRLKLKAQVGEAMNAKHEMELLAQEVASVDQWQRKMQALKAVYHSDKAVLKDELAKAQDFIEQQDADLYELKEKLREAESNVYRSQTEKQSMEAETREMARLLQMAEAEYGSKLQQLEKKEQDDAEERRLLDMRVREGLETEARLRQSILLLESRFSKKSGSRPNSSLGKVVRRRSSTIGGGEPSPRIHIPSLPSRSLTSSPVPSSPTPSPTRPHIPRLALGGAKNEVTPSSDAPKLGSAKTETETPKTDSSSRVRTEREGGSTETGRRTRREEFEAEVEQDELDEEIEEEDEEGEIDDEDEEEGEMADITVSLVDVLGMVKYKGERTSALQERIHFLTQKITHLHHQQHILHLQRLHTHQLDSIKKSKGGGGEGLEGEKRWWGRRRREQVVFVFVVFVVVVVGIFLLELRKMVDFDSLHPS